MTLLKLLETKKRQYEELNVETITKILNRKNIVIEKVTFDNKYKDEIIYDLNHINRC